MTATLWEAFKAATLGFTIGLIVVEFLKWLG
jgi:hypothetical protein